jgi:Tfp pilus assembly protein PilO
MISKQGAMRGVLAMKKTASLPIWALSGILTILLIPIFLWQLKTNSGLRQEFAAKRKELKDTQRASRRLAQLEKQSQELKRRKDALTKRVPTQEKEPLPLIKTLMQLGTKIGLRKISFRVTASSALTTQSGYRPGPGLSSLYFGMECEGNFTQVLNFLEEVNNLERIVVLEKIEIQRRKEFLPYQKIFMNFVTYAFSTK